MSTAKEILMANENVNDVELATLAVENISNGIKTLFNEADFTGKFKRTETTEDGKEVEYYVRKFELANPKKDLSAITIQNKDFIQSAEKVLAIDNIKDATNFVLYRELYNMSKTDVVEKTSFKSFNALASALFGIATPTVSLYTKVGEYFINEEYQPNDERLDGFKAGHFIELLPLVDCDSKNPLHTILEMLNSGKITTMMSTKAIRKEVQSINSGNDNNNSDDKEEKPLTKKQLENALLERTKEKSEIEDKLKDETAKAQYYEANANTFLNKLKEAEDALKIATDVSQMTDAELINRVLSDLLEIKERGIEVKGVDKFTKTLSEIQF